MRIASGAAPAEGRGMDMLLAFTLAVFAVAGLVKGVIGLGLPTVAMGLLAVVMPPVEAAVLLILPSFVTNLWQMLAGPALGRLVRRLWPMQAGVVVGTLAGAGWLAGTGGGVGAALLGLALVLYAGFGLAARPVVVAPAREPVAGPLCGVLTGLVTAATGVFVLPAVPYLQALGLARDELVQALGLSFTVSTLALAVGLAAGGAVAPADAGPAVLATLAALAGMAAGQRLRRRLDPAAFRRWFFRGLAGLGVALVVKALV